MGVLSEGRPLTWSEIEPVLSVLKKHALKDLIRILDKHRSRTKDAFFWGDEVEFSLVRFEHSLKRVQLALKAHQLLPKLVELSKDNKNEAAHIGCQAEDCNFVVEGVPATPYGCLPVHFNTVEANMKLRRQEVQKLLNDNEFILTLAVFPRLGCAECTHPVYNSDPPNSFERSLCCSDEFKTPNHPRTMFLNKNVIERRKAKVSINVPVFQDVKTMNPFQDDLSSFGIDKWEEQVPTRRDGYIHFDSSSVGWGCCCLQVTFQAASFNESLKLYDQLLPLTGICLALSTACPIWRGYLADVDSRWNVLCDTADDRTSEELKSNVVQFSRYSGAPCYLGETSAKYNDTDLNVDLDVYQKLVEHGCPPTLARHFAHLFSRDPLFVTDEQVYPTKDDSTTFGFEHLNSMVWNSLRFKPPPSDESTSMGWRIEFRPMELQISDFENAALAVFLSLFTRTMLTFDIDLRMPISLVNDNMDRAQKRNTVQECKFHFRQKILPAEGDQKLWNFYFYYHLDDNFDQSRLAEGETREMSLNEIINGSATFVGIKPLIEKYLNTLENIDTATRETLNKYLELISQRAAGTLLTNAAWMRQFVINHPAYKQDSIVNDEIQYDLMWFIQQAANGKEFLPCVRPVHMTSASELLVLKP